MRLNSRLLLLLASVVAISAIADDEPPALQRERDLQEAAQVAKSKHIPILLMFAADHCNYCEQLEADHLRWMAANTEYQGKVLVRKVMIDDYYDVRDFEGNNLAGNVLARRYGVQVTPTMLLLDEKGTRIGHKIIGYNSNVYFGWDLDQAINAAREKIN